MTDPYQVLGITPNASDEDVKAAYRELARKYHPDGYTGNPLSDLAAEKMKEVNEAYDRIMAQRRSAAAQTGQPGGSGAGSQFSDIRRLIANGRITQAEELLDGVPQYARDGEWFFLKGTIQHTRGWLDSAFENINRACDLSPGNPEYQAARNQLQWQRQTGQPFGGRKTVYVGGSRGCLTGCSVCDICATLYCVNCCCGGLGGNCC